MKSKIFRKQVALVTFGVADHISSGYAIIERARIVTYHGVKFIEAVHAHHSADYIQGKRILIPLANLTSITEFDSAQEIFNRGKKRRRR